MPKRAFHRLTAASGFYLAAFLWVFAASAGMAAAAEVPRAAALIIDANSGKVLHDVNGDELRYPASLTKLMTLYLVFEALDQGRLQPDTLLTVSEAAAGVAPSKLDLAAGDTIALSDAIKALVTKSANDMAVAIAEKIAGDERTFAELMTKRAHQIGMRQTTFRNASGLPDSAQQTTARDMLTLALRIYDDFPERARVFSLREFTYQGKTYRTHNTLMKSFAGMDGMKTGYTSASGFNLVASVHRDGKHLVAAVFGGVTASQRNAHMRQILTKALEDASTEKTRVAKPQLIASARAVARPNPVAAPIKVAAVALALATPAPAVKPAPIKLALAAKSAAARPPVETTRPAAVTPSSAFAPAVAGVQSVSVLPPAPVVPPEQSVSVTPPITTTAVQTLALSPANDPADGPRAAESGPEPVTNLKVDPPSSAAPDPVPGQHAVSVTPPPVPTMTATANAAPKLDFAGLRRAILGPGPPSPAVAADPKKATTLAPAASEPPRADETNVEKVGQNAQTGLGREPSTLDAQASVVSSTMPGTPAPGTAVSVAYSPPSRPPSTLAAQADSIAAPVLVATAEPAMHLSGPAGPARAITAAAPAIQIGAYSSQAEAERQLAAVKTRAEALLAGTSPISRRIESGGRALFAARFTGLDAIASAKACADLRQRAIDCFVVQSK